MSECVCVYVCVCVCVCVCLVCLCACVYEYVCVSKAWVLFFIVSKQGPCFTAMEEEGGYKRLVQNEKGEWGEEEKNKIATGFYPHSDEPRVKDTARLTSKAFYSAMVCVCLCVCAKRETVHIDRLCGSTPINPLPPPPPPREEKCRAYPPFPPPRGG